MSKVIPTLILSGLVALSLQGCIEMAVGTAVVSTLAATDRRTFGAQTEDTTITIKGETRIKNNFPAAHVNVTSFNRKVVLTGEVQNDAMRGAIEKEIGTIDGVLAVANELEIAGNSSFTERSNDILISTKVKASLIERKDLSSQAIKVVTERSIVYLLGRVTEDEGKVAAEVASGVSGVRKVVKLFEYISRDELRRISGGV